MANLYNKAGLVNIPIGYSDGFLYNIKPVDNTLAFRFNRDSSATRVNKQGLIEQVSYFGPELVTNGNFATDSDWALRFVVIEDGVAKFQESVGTYARVRQNTGFTGQAKVTYTISFNNTSITTIQLRDYGGADATNVPATVGTHTLYRNFTTSAINFQSGDLAAGEEIHLDNVSVVEVLGDKPRIDYTDSLTSPSFLLEPQRTNLITYSEDFNSADWNRSDLTITSDDAISPYGTSTADKIAFTGNGSLRASNTFTFTDAYTYSIFVKKGNTRYVTLRSFAFTTSAIVGFDLDSVTAQAGGVIEQYPNDWFRLSISKDVSSDADKNGYFYFYLPNSLGSTTSVNGNYAYIFGNQIEEGSYATSYIPTSGSTATRVAETCNGAGSASTFNDSEGVLYAEIAALADDSTNRLLSINDSTSSNSIWLYFNTANNVTYSVRVGGIAQASATHTIDIKTFNKIAIKYKENDFAVWFNGVKTLTDTSGNTYTSGTLNNISFDAGDGGLDFYGKVKSVYVFNEALTDDELQQLTS